VTMLAHNCAVLGISVDTYRLFSGDDPHYELWLSLLAEKVQATHRNSAKT
jgi:hypothetical protein